MELSTLPSHPCYLSLQLYLSFITVIPANKEFRVLLKRNREHRRVWAVRQSWLVRSAGHNQKSMLGIRSRVQNAGTELFRQALTLSPWRQGQIWTKLEDAPGLHLLGNWLLVCGQRLGFLYQGCKDGSVVNGAWSSCRGQVWLAAPCQTCQTAHNSL